MPNRNIVEHRLLECGHVVKIYHAHSVTRSKRSKCPVCLRFKAYRVIHSERRERAVLPCRTAAKGS